MSRTHHACLAPALRSQDKNRYNPITGQQRGSDGSLAPVTDPWQHQRVGVKAMEPRAAAADTLKAQAEQQQRSLAITEMRRERIANGGERVLLSIWVLKAHLEHRAIH